MSNYSPRDVFEEELIDAFSSLKTKADFANFLRDLLTQKELTEFANRLQIAKLLQANKHSYLEIASKTGASTTTVSRVAQWLHHGHGGYHKVLNSKK